MYSRKNFDKFSGYKNGPTTATKHQIFPWPAIIITRSIASIIFNTPGSKDPGVKNKS